MGEYIEREVALKFQYWEGCGNIRYGVVAVSDIENIPASDVMPVVHGRWVPKADGFWKKQILICSNCETRNALNYEFNYCPNCGARMDGE